MRDAKIYVKIMLNFVIAIVIVLFVFLLLPKVLGFFMPFVIGWIVSMIANPLVKFLEKKVKILRKHSSAIIIVVVIAAIVGMIYLIIALIVKEFKSLSSDLPNLFTQLELQFNDLSERLRDLSASLPVNLQNMINNVINEISNNITNFDVNESKFLNLNTAGNFAKNVAEIFLLTIISILSAYFFIAKRDELIGKLKRNLPNSISTGWVLIYDNFKTAVGGYFKAQFKIMLIITVIMFVGFEILYVSYSFLLALGIAFLDFLPVFGTGAILWPWALIDMFMGNYMRAIGIVVIYLVCQIVKQILQPKMVGDSIGISPLATLAFMFVGYRLYGVPGMILGVPVGMVIVNLYRVGMFDRLIKGFKIIVHDVNEFRKF